MRSRDEMLELLLSHRGTYLSGEEAAERLHISRNAVWKAIEKLRSEGYEIEAAPRRGYRLAEHNDILSPGELLRDIGLPFTADRIHVFDQVESTNRTAKELAIGGAPHGTVVMADRQSRGNGRHERTFFSPEGGIYLSIILRGDQIAYQSSSMITISAAAFAAEAIEEICGKSPGIKWINDLFLDGKKIGGILTESASGFESGELEWVVIGIGINFRTREDSFPEELKNIAGSIYPDGKNAVSRSELAGSIIRKILTAGSKKREKILDSYRSRLMLRGETVLIQQKGVARKGVIVGVDDEGRLIVQMENGETERYSSGEISTRRI
ncbi:MAG: biotin--[acetyl-CoA-carboxylase] ligase [Bilifractor sp.]|jgi:BirA family biotin operon repressor/biotin-[acetyl-CoA-carboxylase] ligase